MKIEFTKEELVTLLNGLYAGANGALNMAEQETYEALADRIEKEWFKHDLNVKAL